MTNVTKPSDPVPSDAPVTLERVIGLPLLVLYGLGITIGAGIYVLISTAAAQAGPAAPSAFLLSATVMLFSALSFAELSGRIPKAAGEAAYVDAGFGWNALTLLTGLLILVAATVAGAAISIGCAGYVAYFVPLPIPVIATGIVCLMGLIATRNIKQSVMIAGVLTVFEVLGLLVIVVSGFMADPGMIARLPSAFPALGDTAALAGVFGASLIAFFAFIGFDDVVNLVEETRDPKKTMPWAILISLVVVTVIYFLVVFVAVQSVPIEVLAGSTAPIGLLFEELTGFSPWGITLIAIGATINGVLIEILMAARVTYGLGNQGRLPRFFAKISRGTRVPLNATFAVTAVMLALALFVPLEALVEATSQMILVAFVLVNAALIVIKRRGDAAPEGVFIVPVLCPVLGVLTCLLLLVGPFVFG